MKYIEHYTEPGDIVFDGFCGSGMTGVAAQLLDRRAILGDLSPAATFIAYNYNTPVDVAKFEREAKRILREVERECGWMYETVHTDGKTRGRINYTVWSDVFICPYCGGEYVFWEAAVDIVNGKVEDEYLCPYCSASISKRDSQRATITFYDLAIGQNVTRVKRIPVIINYTVGKKRFQKKPDQSDLDLIQKIEESTIPYWYPTNPMLNKGEKWGDTWRAGCHLGITHVHHFFTKRNLWVLAAFNSKAIKFKSLIISVLLGINARASIRNRYMPEYGNRHVGTLSGTLYVPTLFEENNLFGSIKLRLSKIIKILKLNKFVKSKILISTNSLTEMKTLADNTIDYIFTDPPFGDNLMYSELNFLWEAWLQVITNNNKEAIINDSQNKSLNEYKELMTECFKECYRVLKPNHWITVEFHNSKASVWNAIQDALAKAGFVIAQVAVIDKQKGTTKQLSYAGTVKNDLVINAYKPKIRFVELFLKRTGEGLERDFVSEHLEHLPVAPNIGRTEQMLYSKMLAHYVQRGYEIRLSARQFYTLLKDNFKLIDGYWFTDWQVLKYEEWKKKQGLAGLKEIKTGQQVLLVGDERSALVWLYNFLEIPQTYSDIYTAYSKAITVSDDAIPELRELLDHNFIFEDKCYRRPKDGREKETVEVQRERDLARTFERLLAEAGSGGKKLKGVRQEAVIFGFTKAYQEKRYHNILTVAKKLDKNILEANSELNDFVEIARLKTGEEF
jgi:16S rRNA G966 N2-methylase RsmD